MIKEPFTLKSKAKQEIYSFIEKKFKKLPKKSDGTFDEFADGFVDNDVDALRHAYVSGLFTHEYGESIADFLGRINEYSPGGGSSSSNSEYSTNMDLWNNRVGRNLAKKHAAKRDFLNSLMKALKNGELITDPLNDPRKYEGAGLTKLLDGLILVLKENKKGRNEIFYDLNKKQVMDRKEFVHLIKDGIYPDFEIRKIGRDEIPASKKDGLLINNLG